MSLLGTTGAVFALDTAAMILSIIVQTLILAAVWLVMSGFDASFFSLALGAVASLAVATINCRLFSDHTSPSLSSLFRLAAFNIWLACKVVVANFVVAKTIISPKLDISPRFHTVSMPVCSEFHRFVLANAVTLTPGTIATEVDSVTGITVHNLRGSKTTDHKVPAPAMFYWLARCRPGT